jgi:hypothetical protein
VELARVGGTFALASISPTQPMIPSSVRHAIVPAATTLALLASALSAQAPHPVGSPPQMESAATTPAISAPDLRVRVGIIAADSMQGRDTGTPGIRKARDYIAGELQRMGVRPAGDGGTYLAAVDLERTVTTFSASAHAAVGEATLSPDAIVPLVGIAGVPGLPRPSGEGRVVYGGYAVDGGVAPERELRAADLDGAVLVVRLGASPRQRFSLESLWSPSSRLAAILVVNEGMMKDYWDAGAEALRVGALARKGVLTPDRVAGGPPLFLVSPALAERLIGRPLRGAREPFVAGGTFRYELRSAIEPVQAWNIVGVVPGGDPGRAGEYVALGAHYDHVGVGAPVRGDSIYNGADDDGSGTAALLEISERYASTPPSGRPARSLLFVWHTGEEKGLLGSEAFTEHPTVPLDSIVAQLNVDMIGRNSPDSLYLVGSRRLATRLGDLIEQVNGREPRPFRLDYSLDSPNHPEHLYCRSDHYNYARFGIPVTFFTSGLHPDYHEPSDEPRTLDYDKLARAATLIGDVAREVASLPERLKRDRPLPPIGEPCT